MPEREPVQELVLGPEPGQVPEPVLVRALAPELVLDRGRDLDPGPDRDQNRHLDPESGSGLV